MSQEPVNIMGVVAFPNENGQREIRFIDSEYNNLFTVPDGGNIILTHFDGKSVILPCRYIDDYHAQIGASVCCGESPGTDKNPAGCSEGRGQRSLSRAAGAFPAKSHAPAGGTGKGGFGWETKSADRPADETGTGSRL